MLTTIGLGLLAVVIALIVALVATFVWSSDAGRRGRARDMLVLLLTHAPLMTSRSANAVGASLRPPWLEEPYGASDGVAGSAAAHASYSEADRP